ncbi:carboxylesterase/lipase family protein [Agromyces sp. ISL-38]|uniref:carboxylesterase/lipase family protein n=1 Tax=Agromyces sp. ISL-38 TaxID=2819107 RepID=UPI001BEB5E2C|nr:carboxylesterase/lipase family protein [Agromyces sp. ISL-38]MBT2499173.1 carboxylesterase/lipase family protein [Agromyces sp. ISL-38]
MGANVIAPNRSLDEELDVQVAGGMVRGVLEDGLLAWRGIPYAAPPLGDLRFAPPAEVVPWDGIRDASAFGPIAPQPFSYRLIRPPSAVVPTAEDCLTVNVRAPVRDAGERTLLPVLVFIHGGGNSAGSSRDFSGQGEGFVQSGRIVYVSFNYRLGALGYLDFTGYSSPERSFASNLGLRDQVALLRWVRDNISGFGGDPDNVTVFGESAGGNAVTTLMATPSARGLFARAIAQSPPPTAVYASAVTSRWAQEFVDILRDVVGAREASDGDAGADGVALSPQQLLSDASVDDLVAASAILQASVPDAYPGAFCFAPVVDGEFLPESPIRAFRDGRAHRVPLIIGTNDREGSIFRGRVDILPRTPERIDALFERAPLSAHQAMRDAYPGLPGLRAGADFGGDYGFWFPSTRVADFHSRYAPVWSYRFDVAPRLLELLGLNATHGVEMFALFDSTEEPLARVMTSLGGQEAYAAAGERMRTLWLQFAEDGVPAEAWPRYEERTRSTLIVDAEDRIEADPRRERRRAWNRFIPSLAG